MHTMNLIPVKEAAKAVRVSEALLRKLVREGRVPFYRLSPRSLRFDLSELRDYMRLIAEGKPIVSDDQIDNRLAPIVSDITASPELK